jgi:hypothetical protein
VAYDRRRDIIERQCLSELCDTLGNRVHFGHVLPNSSERLSPHRPLIALRSPALRPSNTHFCAT